jgi:hypothetical protein
METGDDVDELDIDSSRKYVSRELYRTSVSLDSEVRYWLIEYDDGMRIAHAHRDKSKYSSL